MEVLTNTLEKFRAVRKNSIELCAPLLPEDYVVQPVEDVSPPKWHLGHTTWFFETFILSGYQKNFKLFHKRYNYLFNSYYESAGERIYRSNRGNITRPTIEEIFKYREYIDNEMEEFLNKNEEIPAKLAFLLELGLQHEQQHQELLVTDIKYILGHNPLFPAYTDSERPQLYQDFEKEEYISIDEGVYEIGASNEGFKFDNELGVHKVYIQPFRFSNRLVTNAEYLEFIEDKGYQDFRHWLSEGWDWVNKNKIESPLYWFRIDDKWHYYTLHGLREVNLHEPVTHISYFEANAYASWKGKRLLTEFEWEVACRLTNSAIPENANFLDLKNFKPIPKQAGNNQMYGDVWEWTQSAYLPYPNFKREEGAIGEYNGKFMINQMVLRGGSCATMREHIRPTYRNFFHPDKRWQFTGIRLSETL